MIAFSHPGYLLLLLLSPWLIGVSRRSLAGLRPGRARLALGLRLAIFVLLVLGLSGLQVARPSRTLTVLFLLDLSDSIPRDRQDAALRFVDGVARRMGPHDRAGVIVFGSDAYVEYLPRPGLRVGGVHTVLSRQYTDIAGAIRLALAAFPDDTQKRIVLLSDGNENHGRAVEEAAAAMAAGVSIDVVPIPYAYERELLLEKMTAPGEAKQGEPLELKVLATATHDTTATLRLWRNDQLVSEQPIRLLKGKSLLSVPQTITQPGFHRFEAQLSGEGDTRAENNRALTFTHVRGRPRVLYVEGRREEGRFLAQALRGQEVDVELRGAEQIPTNLAEFQNYDSVILSNVGAWRLSADQMKMLQSNVRDLGAGLVMIGGEQSFGAGAYGGTPIEAALPVEMDVQKQKQMPTGAVAMIMHSCEFPDGNQWAAETAAGVIEVLGSRDHVGVLLYDSGDRWGIPLQPVRDKAALQQQVFQLQPGDMPSFEPTLRLAYDALRAVDARVKHIIILSDGDPSPPTDSLLQAIVKAKITISTVAVFPHDTLAPTLQVIARIGKGRFYNVTSAAQIPRIFLKEATTVLKPAVIEEPFFPKVDPTSPFLKGVAPASIPPLLGYVAASPKPVADVAMLTKRDDPLLASWQYGLGRAVAFTSDAKNRWAAHWVDWENYAKFWAQVVRWTIRSTARTPLETSVAIERRQGHVTLDAVDETGAFLNFLDLTGNVVTPERTLKLKLQQTAPGRYEGSFDAPDVGQYIVSIAYRDAQGRRRLHTTGTAVPYSPEYRELEANTATLVRIAETTGGRVLPALGGEDPLARDEATQVRSDADTKHGGARARHGAASSTDLAATIFRRDRRTRATPQDLWPLLFLLAALLFPIDVAVRRLMIEPAEALAWAQRGRAWVVARLPHWRRRAPRPREPVLERLLVRKERAVARMEKEHPAEDPQGAPGTEPAPRVVWSRPVPGIAASSERTPPGDGRGETNASSDEPPLAPAQSADTPLPIAEEGTNPPPGTGPLAPPEEPATRRLLGAKRRARGDRDQRRA